MGIGGSAGRGGRARLACAGFAGGGTFISGCRHRSWFSVLELLGAGLPFGFKMPFDGFFPFFLRGFFLLFELFFDGAVALLIEELIEVIRFSFHVGDLLFYNSNEPQRYAFISRLS